MISKYIQRHKRWRENVPLMSPFVIGCGVVAVVYFCYRIFLIASPAIVLEQTAFNPIGNEKIVCGEEEGNHLKDPEPILSVSYQKRIHDLRPTGQNEVINPGLTRVDAETSQPVGYSHSADSADSHYDLLQDADGSYFLQTSGVKAASESVVPSAWQIDPVAVQPDGTYAYSFWYRSDVPINVSAEYTADNGETHYSEVTTLKEAASWQQFAAHFDNDKKARSLRVNLNAAATGRVDTRTFDIHQVAGARLNAGLVSVTFDDGWQSINDKALVLLEKYHIRTTQYIISDVASHAVPEYMNFGTIKKLKATGQEIGSHSLTHCNQTELKAADIQNNALRSKQLLEQQGLGPIKSFAYPLGQYNDKTQATYEKYYPLIRSSDFGYNDRYFDETNIHSIGILSSTSDREFQSHLDYAKSNRLWVVLVYHRVDTAGDYNLTSAQLDRQLHMIASSGLKTLPLSEAAAAIRKQ